MSNINTAKRYVDYHSPEAIVLLNGEKLITKGIDISEVIVEQILDGASTFSFIIPQALNDKFVPKYQGEIYFGAKIEIFLGYKDKLFSVITGMVTSLSWGFDKENYLDMIVEGYDYLFLLMKNEKFLAWNKLSDSNMIHNIVSQYPFKNLNIEATELIHQQIRQEAESDFTFLKRLSYRNGYEFFVHGEDFICRSLGVEKQSIYSLQLGKELLDFHPKVDISQQISEVKVIGWNPNSKREIVAIANNHDIKNVESKGENGTETIQSVLKNDAIHQVRTSIQNPDEAQALAISIMQESAYKLLKAECKAIGLPELRPAQVIALENVSNLFSRKYYVEKVTHEFGKNGYETYFTIKGSTYDASF